MSISKAIATTECRLDWFLADACPQPHIGIYVTTRKSFENGDAPETDPIFTFKLPRRDKLVADLLQDALSSACDAANAANPTSPSHALQEALRSLTNSGRAKNPAVASMVADLNKTKQRLDFTTWFGADRMSVVPVPASVLASIIDQANSHIEDIESGLEEGFYAADENADLPKKQAAVAIAEDAYRAAAMPSPAAVGNAPVGSVREVMMQDLVGEYDIPDTVPEWQWLESNASYGHIKNGTDGIWEFVLNLSRSFENVPLKLQQVIATAKEEGVSYLIFHQGT